jgi:hypothetical protein
MKSFAGYLNCDSFSVRAVYAEKEQSSDSNGTDVLE